MTFRISKACLVVGAVVLSWATVGSQGRASRESLVARAKTLELDTPYVPPPGHFLTLVKLGDDLVFHQKALQWLRSSLAEQKSKSQKIDVAKFKDLTGVSRKYAIPLLEYLDREHVTRRVGDERIIL